MFGTLVAAAALTLAPAQASTLNFTNVRTTYGELGAVRTDNKYLPGDIYFLTFDVEGITIAPPDGKVSYGMTFEVTDRAGKVVYKPPQMAESEELFPLGGNRMPARVYFLLDRDRPAGIYTCKVTVIDRANKVTKDLVRTLEVLPKTFGLVAIVTSYDDKGDVPAPPGGTVGQNLWVHGALVGFGRGPDKAPNAFVELRILDEARRPTLAKPLAATVPKDIPPTEDLVTVRFLVPFNREGTYTAELKATDSTTGKTSVVSFPFRVGPAVK